MTFVDKERVGLFCIYDRRYKCYKLVREGTSVLASLSNTVILVMVFLLLTYLVSLPLLPHVRLIFLWKYKIYSLCSRKAFFLFFKIEKMGGYINTFSTSERKHRKERGKHYEENKKY